VGLNKLVSRVYGFLVFLIPFLRFGLAFGGVKFWEPPPQCMDQEFRKIDARFLGGLD
jgi:hypothetical protein